MANKKITKAVLNKAKSEVDQHITITRDTKKKTHFKVAPYKGVYNKTMSTQAPQWFQTFEEKNDARWDKQEQFNEEQRKVNKKQEEFNNEQREVNKKQEEFNNEQREVNKKQEAWNSKYEPVLEKLLKHAGDIFPDKKNNN